MIKKTQDLGLKKRHSKTWISIKKGGFYEKWGLRILFKTVNNRPETAKITTRFLFPDLLKSFYVLTWMWVSKKLFTYFNI